MAEPVQRDEVSVDVDAPPEVVFGLIADPDEMARWHPAVDAVGWDEATPAVEKGRRFHISNVDARFDWQHDHCEIIEVVPPRTFAFARIDHQREVAHWRYTVEPRGGGSRVTAVHELLHERLTERIDHLVRPARNDVAAAIELALAGLKEAAEASVQPA